MQPVAVGEFALATDRIDVLLRRWPTNLDALVQALPDVLSNETGYQEVLEILAEDPPWRGPLFDALATDPRTLPAASRLLQQLVDSPNPPRNAELATIGSALIRQHRFQDAYRLFLLTLSQDERTISGYVHNAEFKGPFTGRPFDWQVRDQPGYRLTASDGGTESAGLEIQFNGTPLKKVGLQQYLQLSAGSYVLEIAVAGSGATMPKGLFWTVQCNGDGRLLARIDVPEGTFETETLRAPFSLDGNDCQLQVIGLHTSSIAGSWKNRYTGRVRFRNVRIEKVMS